MIICSIDLMDGKAVQLKQGKEHVLTSDKDPIELAKEFNRYGEIAVIDLDAALGKGDNLPLIKEICRVADVRAGGGIRDEARGTALLKAGAKQIIVGTAATPEFLSKFPKEQVMVALDHRQGQVLDQGWTHEAGETIEARAQRLAPYCGSYLCTFVANEGSLTGMPMDEVKEIIQQMPHPVTVAGGVASTQEVVDLSKMGLDIQVGMALYTGKLDPVASVVNSLDFEKMGGLIPTIVQDNRGEVLMLAYSSPASLTQALQTGQGVYFSRSRNEIWQKGLTSGNIQKLISCRVDCDRDAILFRVVQEGPACHLKTRTCFGSDRFSLPKLFDILKQRKEAAMAGNAEGSYSAKLFNNRKLLLRKLMEEAYEVVTAENFEELRWETADLLYFASLLAVDEGLEWTDITSELGGRHK
jgi:phosphoribosyl-AMP cyclohydrolase / phosphoribosyl-ATP pyrophosphohydrolase